MGVYGMKDASDLIWVKRGTKDVVLRMDYANTTGVEWKADRVFAKKKGANAIAWDAAKTGEMTIETELFDAKLLAMLVGDDLGTGSSEVFRAENYSLSSDHLIKLKDAAVDGSVSVFRLKEDNISHDIQIPQKVTGEAGSAPVMVEGVSVTVKDKTSEITWTASRGASTYEVYRDGVRVGQPVTASFNDSNLTPQTQYKYTVIAVNANGHSPKSAEVVVTTAADGTTVAGSAVTATSQAIQAAKAVASAQETNGINFEVTESGALKLSEACATNAKYVVYYMAKVEGLSSFTVNSQKFADNYELYGNSFIRDEKNGEDHFVQFHFFNAKPQTNFTFSQNSKDPTSLSIKVDLLPNEDNNLADYKMAEA